MIQANRSLIRDISLETEKKQWLMSAVVYRLFFSRIFEASSDCSDNLMDCFVCFLFSFVSFLRRSITLLPRMECSGMTSAHCNLWLPDSSTSPASVSLVAEITGTCHHTELIFVFLVETEFHHVGQAGLEPLTLSVWPPKVLGLQA